MRTPLTSTLLLGALATVALPALANAQSARARSSDRTVDRDRETTIVRTGDDDPDARAVLGISTNSSGDRDTLGLLITSVTPNSPAEKAGLEEGNRIAAINGVNLRLAAADAGENDVVGLTSRRLTREMRKVKAGDEVTLKVWKDGAFRDVKVKTVAAEDLAPRRVSFSRDEWEDRPVFGFNLGGNGSKRDTLGVLLMGIDDGSPAEKAGLVEGDRIQSVNGVDVRVRGEDAGDGWVSNARSQRLRRELQKAKVGDAVELRVWSGGQVKTVKVSPVRAGDLYKDRGRMGGARFYFGDGGFGVVAPPAPPVPPMPPEAFFGPGTMSIDGDAIRMRVDEAMARAREAIDRVRVTAPRVYMTPRTELQARPIIKVKRNDVTYI